MNRNLRNVAFGVAVLVILAGCAARRKARAERRQQREAQQRTAYIESTLYYPLGRRSDAVLRVDREFPGSVTAGQEFGYTIRVANVSSMVVSDVIVDERVPANYTMTASSPEATPIDGGLTWSFNMGRLGPGESRIITIYGTAADAGIVSTTATVTYLIPVGMDVRVAGTTTASPTVMQPTGSGGVGDVITLLSDQEGPVTVGDQHEYLYELENQGQVDLTNLRVTLTMQDGMEFVSSGTQANHLVDGRVEFPLGTVGVGQRRSVQFIVRANAAGEYRVVTDSSADQLPWATREDEITVFVER